MNTAPVRPGPRPKPEYQTESDDELRELIWNAGRITPLQLFRIAAWKSAKGLAPISLNSEELIADVTAATLATIAPYRDVDALRDDVDWGAWESAAATAIGRSSKGRSSAGTGLLALSGFGYAMSTAFLSWLAPAAFPVMDKWTNLAVFGRGLGQRWERAAVYSVFAQRLGVVAPELVEWDTRPTIHQVDVAVMNAMIGCAHPRDECTCVPFSAVGLPTKASSAAQPAGGWE